MTTVWEYNDGTTLTRDTGNFDDWCIYVNGNAPFDRDYFNQLHDLSNDFGVQKVYNDFKTLYDATFDEIDNQIFENVIPQIASSYNERRFETEKLFGTLYLVMLAEENRILNKENNIKTKLGKSIKALAIYQIFFENYTIDEACSFSIGKPWRVIKELCEERNIFR